MTQNDERRERKALAAARKRVTFGRAESISTVANDDRTIAVLIDGKFVTDIVIHVEDVGASTHVYRVSGYSFLDETIPVDFTGQSLGDVDDLQLSRREMGVKGAARAKLALAKRRVIAAVARGMMAVGKV